MIFTSRGIELDLSIFINYNNFI